MTHARNDQDAGVRIRPATFLVVLSLLVAAGCGKPSDTGADVEQPADTTNAGAQTSTNMRGSAPAPRQPTIYAGPAVRPPAVLDPDHDRPGLSVGDRVPDLTLPTPAGDTIDLASLRRSGLLIVLFYEGGWRPEALMNLLEWSKQSDELSSLGVRLVAITPESPEHAQTTLTQTDVRFPILCDVKGEAMRGFNIAYNVTETRRERFNLGDVDLSVWNASGEAQLPAPAVFIVDREGMVRWSYSNWDPTNRARPADVVAAAKIHK